MKLTKELESEILNVYHAYWDAYLKGDMQHFANRLDEDLSVFGTAISEVFNNKDEAVSFYNATAEQMVGKAEFRNRQITVQLVGDSIFIREQNDLFVLLENEWSFYAHARVTAIFRQRKGEWKLVHQHASFPDNRAEEGEQIAAEKIKNENLELKEAVKRRTVELEYKNRELEIEAALERTRTHSMLMQHSNELDITSRVFHEQLLLLGIDSELSYVWLPDVENDKHLFWATWNEEDNGSTILQSKSATYDLDRSEPYTAECFTAWESGEPVHVYAVAPDQVKNYLDTWSGIMGDAKKLKPEFFPEGLDYVESFMKYGCFGIIVRRSLTEDEKKILFRFTVEFERTYTRFLDLQKAEEQTRESQIELGLERVRARTMAMQHSSELQDAAIVLFDQMKTLGIHTGSCGFNIWNKKEAYATVWMSSPEGGLQTPFTLPLTKSAVYKEVYEAMKKGEDLLVKEVSGKDLIKHFDYLLTLHGIGDVIKKLRETGYLFPETIVFHFAFFTQGYLSFHLHEPHPQAHDIFIRFAKVFEQTYTRFLDLQRAEGQAREAQIEAALERVRSRTMGMQKSEELREVIQVVYEQFGHLNIHIGHTGFVMDYKARDDYNIWVADPLGVPSQVVIPYFDSVYYNRFNEAKEKGEDFFATNLSFEEKNRFYDKLFEYVPGLTEEAKEFYFSCPGLAASTVLLENVALYIENFSGIPYTDEENNTLMRFGKVFQQTYTRFLDLKNAEAQAKEARIETALEKVRSRSLSMHKSDELEQVVAVVLDRLVELGFVIDDGAAVHLGIFVDGTKDFIQWSADPLRKEIIRSKIPFTNLPVLTDFFDAKEKGLDFFTKAYSFEEKNVWFNYAFEYSDLIYLPEDLKQVLLQAESYEHWIAIEKNSALVVNSISGSKLSETQIEILKRFARVFEQAYVRFLDLQKAEAQAREAQIELGLERVRARAMAMQNSNELKELISTVFIELTKLDLVLTRCLIMIYDTPSNASTWWMANSEMPADPIGLYVKYHQLPPYASYISGWKERKNRWQYTLEGKDKDEWDDFLFGETELSQLPDFVKAGMKEPGKVFLSASFNNFGCLNLATLEPLSDEHFDILLRFAKVFDLTYTRFNDLQKAEEQARDAKIEVALERVRSRAMAMHRSEELADAAILLYRELRLLEITHFFNCGYVLIDEPLNIQHAWMTHADGTIREEHTMPLTGDTIMNDRYEQWKQKVPVVSQQVGGKPLQDHLAFVAGHTLTAGGVDTVSSNMPDPTFFYCGNFSEGYLHLLANTALNKEEENILSRFTNVFEITFRRFRDLEKAEAQAREAMIEASLERVRGKAMAMHSSHDLADTISAFYNELQSFSITPRRCGVGLLNRETRVAELSTMNTTDDGDSIEIIGTVKMADHPVLDGVYENWLLQKEYHPVLRGAEIPDYYRLLKPQITFPDYPDDAVQYGYFFFFPEGGVYAWIEKQMIEEELIIYRRFTSVLSLTYKRYKDLQQAEDLASQAAEDLKNLKVEKKRTEDALTELKNTQSQLIQSEKMASLGELTAGIAHEIQNPLNFVNNFSEVSNELLDEMLQEVARGNYDEVKAIVDDVKQNLEKIHHHGKRADGIVKGMLQHSRATSNTKEPSDINVLADEYLRLAYHGLRAKDKSFNVTLETEYDKNIGKINIIPQDIGRVVLNLINNAFYAVDEKNKKHPEGYIPTISVSTKRINDRVEICVADNGNGIPQNVVEKIFQPFFTTKPTGQGTGLGLSLSYDIVKAHGGELKVETKEGAGTGFIVTIPIG